MPAALATRRLEVLTQEEDKKNKKQNEGHLPNPKVVIDTRVEDPPRFANNKRYEKQQQEVAATRVEGNKTYVCLKDGVFGGC